MGKIIGLLLTLGCLWAGLEVYNNGVQGAFGGRLAFLEDGEKSASRDIRSIPKRAGDAVERALAEAAARRARLLEQ